MVTCWVTNTQEGNGHHHAQQWTSGLQHISFSVCYVSATKLLFAKNSCGVSCPSLPNVVCNHSICSECVHIIVQCRHAKTAGSKTRLLSVHIYPVLFYPGYHNMPSLTVKLIILHRHCCRRGFNTVCHQQLLPSASPDALNLLDWTQHGPIKD